VADAMIHEPKLCPPDITVAEVQSLFNDTHVHAALIVDGGQLISVVERADVSELAPTAEHAARFGCLTDRTISATSSLDTIYRQMVGDGRRRLAVIGRENRLLGLLCLKASGTGYCSDRDVQARGRER
jgi:CBS domain-containing protein